MAYYIFLKSLRSLEEFCKIPHDKIPSKSPSINFQSLGKFKIQFLIQKFFFLISARPTLRPIQPLSPASPLTAPPPQAETVLAGPSSPRVGRVFAGNISSLLVHAFPSRLPLPRVSVNRAPDVSSIPHLQPPELARAFISPPLISLLILSSSRPVFNGVKAINTGVNRPGHPSPALPRPL
jgi:hypothetical protein